MSNEIAIGPRIMNGNRDVYEVAFWVALDAAKIKTVDGQAGSSNVVETPGVDLPKWARFVASVVDGLNNGEAVWVRRFLDIHPSDTTQDLVDRVQSMYANWAGGIQARYDSKYARIGTLVDSA